LAAILRQNPAVTATMSTPVFGLVRAAITQMSRSENGAFFDEARRDRVVRALMTACYLGAGDAVDTCRMWTSQMPLIARLYPQATVICCVRNIGWIVNSFERVFAANPLTATKIFREPKLSVYERAAAMMAECGVIARAYAALKEAWFGPHAGQLLVIDYDRLIETPRLVLSEIYERLGFAPFEHDFERVEYEEPLFDASIATPGLHSVSGRVRRVTPKLLIPPDLFDRYRDSAFWNLPGYNVRSVAVLSPLGALKATDENPSERCRAA
jgi:sulfotransferase